MLFDRCRILSVHSLAVLKKSSSDCSGMDYLVLASAVAPRGVPVILPALAGAGILFFLSQLFVPKS